MVKILYFAWVREAIGLDGEDIALPVSLETAGDVARYLATRSAGHARAFADLDRIRCAVDQTMKPLNAPLGRASELAFFPPVTGG